MAKKKVQTESSEEVEVITPDTESQEQTTAKVATAKAEKKSKKVDKSETEEKTAKNAKSKDVKAKGKAKQKGEKKSIKKLTGEVWSELKKVSKPSFGKVVKNTCVVVVVVAICTVLLFGVDKLFSLLYNLLVS